jgi:hypothetical protein
VEQKELWYLEQPECCEKYDLFDLLKLPGLTSSGEQCLGKGYLDCVEAPVAALYNEEQKVVQL